MSMRSRDRGVRAAAHREKIKNDVSGRRLMKEAQREEALRTGRPLPRGPLARLRDLVRRHDD